MGVQANIVSGEIQGGKTTGVSFGASSYYDIDDLIITPTAGSTFRNGDLIHTSFRFDLNGRLFTNGSQADSEAVFFLNAGVAQGGAGQQGVGGEYTLPTEALNPNMFTSYIDRQGVFADPGQSDTRTDGMEQTLTANVQGTFTTPQFAVFVGSPFSLNLWMGASASVIPTGTFDHYLGTAEADFADTMSFAQSGGVLSLPNGLTLNSAEASIVNNVAAAVPEPMCGVLLSAGVLLGMHWRRPRVAGASVLSA
jgi:hypothetical protein